MTHEWQCDFAIRNGMVHVWPLEDWIEHELDTATCICGPELEQGSAALMVTHASLDGRELVDG